MQLAFKKQPGDNQSEEPAKAKRGARAGKPSKKTTKPVRQSNIGGGRRQRFILIIGDEGAILVYMQGSKVVRRLFAPSPQPSHTEAMVDLMRANPSVPLFLMADVLDQQYIRQSFPPVSSLSVNGLVKRRLDRDFQAEDLKGSLALGRDKTGRKEWNFLLISLAKTSLMTEWLELVVELPNELKGIFLVPVEATIYLAMLRKAVTSEKPLPWQLLVSHNKVSGFRQIVVRDGKLVFTRVTQAIDDAIPAVIAGNIEQEILNTLEYLRRLGFTENNTLEGYFVVSQDVHDALDMKRFGFGQAHVLTPLDVADALGLEQAALSADRFGDVVMAAAFAKAKKRVLPLSTAYAQRLSKLYMARKGLKVAAALAAIALLAMSGMSVMQAIGDSGKAAETETKRQGLQPELEVLKKSISGLNKDVAFKSAVVGTYDAYLKTSSTPLDFVRSLAPLLTPEQRITSVEWGASDAAVSPVDVKVEFEFAGSYADTEILSRSVQSFLDMLKAKLPQWDITTDPFPWLNETQKGVEISFDQQPVGSQIKEGQNKITVKFHGPKKIDTPPAKPPGAP